MCNRKFKLSLRLQHRNDDPVTSDRRLSTKPVKHNPPPLPLVALWIPDYYNTHRPAWNEILSSSVTQFLQFSLGDVGQRVTFPAASCCRIANIISLRAWQAPKLGRTAAVCSLNAGLFNARACSAEQRSRATFLRTIKHSLSLYVTNIRRVAVRAMIDSFSQRSQCVFTCLLISVTFTQKQRAAIRYGNFCNLLENATRTCASNSRKKKKENTVYQNGVYIYEAI